MENVNEKLYNEVKGDPKKLAILREAVEALKPGEFIDSINFDEERGAHEIFVVNDEKGENYSFTINS